MSTPSRRDRLARLWLRQLRRTPAPVLRRRFGSPPEIDGYRLDLRAHVFATVVQQHTAAQGSADLTIDDLRRGMDAIAFLGSGDLPSDVATHDRTIPGPAGELAIRTYRPSHSSGERPAVVWFHQGGSVLGDLDTDHTLCAEIASRAGALVVSVDYRKGPEHPFPADTVDALGAYEWVVANADGLGVDPSRVAVGGSSAGGRLAAAVTIERRNDGLSVPVAMALLFPDADSYADPSVGSFESMAKAWPLGRRAMAAMQAASHRGGQLPPQDGNDRIHRLSALRAVSLVGLPPSVVVTAGFDPLRDSGNALAQSLTEAGVETTARCETALPHSFSLMGGVSRAADRATKRFADDLAEVLGAA